MQGKGGLLFVIFASCGDGKSPVDLLQHHHPGQMVGKGHGGHAQPPVRLLFDALIQPHAAADEKGDLRLSLHAEVRHPAAQLIAGAGLALDAQGDNGPAPGQPFPDGGGLRPGVTAYQRKVTPLDKIAAHGANNGGVSAELLPDGLYQGEVTIMQGIIFCYDTSGFHICHLKAVTK